VNVPIWLRNYKFSNFFLGGHYFPAQANLKQIYIEYFQDRLQDYLEMKELANASILIEDNEGAEDDEDSD
jgi:hypothetical protein